MEEARKSYHSNGNASDCKVIDWLVGSFQDAYTERNRICSYVTEEDKRETIDARREESRTPDDISELVRCISFNVAH